LEFFRNLIKKMRPRKTIKSKEPRENNLRPNLAEDDDYLVAETISRKKMDLLWLDPPRLAQLEKPLSQSKTIRIVLGDSSSQREHEITQEDFQWAKRIERIINKAHAAGKRRKYRESIKYYKEAMQLAPGCDLFLMSIGVGYVQLGQKVKGLRYLERAAEISPSNARIRENLTKARRM